MRLNIYSATSNQELKWIAYIYSRFHLHSSNIIILLFPVYASVRPLAMQHITCKIALFVQTSDDIRAIFLAHLLHLLEKILVQHQHGAALNTGPDKPRSNASKPAGNSFSLVDQLQTCNNR